MNEIQKSESYKKDCMNMILELEKERFLQLQLLQECYKKMEDFRKKGEEKISNYQYKLNQILLKYNTLDKEFSTQLKYLYDKLPEFNILAWAVLSFVFLCISIILYQGFGYEFGILFILPWIISALLCLLPRTIKKRKYLKECEQLKESVKHKKELIKKEEETYDISKFKYNINEEIHTFNKKVNKEIDNINRGIDEIVRNLDSLYNMIEDFPQELRGDLVAVSAIVSYLNQVGEFTHKYWRMSLLDAERVVGLRKVDNCLSDFENRMTEFSAELQSEIEIMIEDYNEEIDNIMGSYIEMNDDFQEKQVSIERKYQRNVDKANAAALKYIGEYHVY